MHSTVSYSASEKPWLILVHGMLTNARHWALNRERLSRAFNLVLIDLPGHGRRAGEALVRHAGVMRWIILSAWLLKPSPTRGPSIAKPMRRGRWRRVPNVWRGCAAMGRGRCEPSISIRALLGAFRPIYGRR